MTWLDVFFVVLGVVWFGVALFLDRRAERDLLKRVEELYRKDVTQ